MKRRSLLSLLSFPAVVRASGTDPLDEMMQGMLGDNNVPGGALGVARGGKIVYAKGFGIANRETGARVTADSRFRIASCSKSITAAAVMRLIEQGKLALDEAVLPKLKLQPFGDLGDARWQRVTVRHLLQHSGGWRKSRSGDPMFQSPQICNDTGCAAPADEKTTVRWMLGRSLDFEPGTDFAYSNFGYCVLGRLIEAMTGQSYASAVHRLVLSPCRAGGMDLGRSLSALSGEVAYYQSGSYPSVFPQLGARASWPYGSFSMEANDANGGWVATATDVLRFLTALDERSSKPLLNARSLQAICESAAPGSSSGSEHHGLGFFVRPQGQGGRPDLWHMGGLPGCKSIMVRLGDGLDWVALFNGTGSFPADFDTFSVEVRNTVHQAMRQVRDWK